MEKIGFAGVSILRFGDGEIILNFPVGPRYSQVRVIGLKIGKLNESLHTNMLRSITPEFSQLDLKLQKGDGGIPFLEY